MIKKLIQKIFICLVISITIASCGLIKQWSDKNSAYSLSRIESEHRLFQATVNLLYADPDTNPEKYAKQQLIFEQALSEYLNLLKSKTEKIIHLSYNGTTIIVPVELYQTEADSVNAAIRGKPVYLLKDLGHRFRGEILDLSSLKSSDGFIALFSDSLIHLSLSGNQGATFSTLQFDPEFKSAIRSLQPGGILFSWSEDTIRSAQIMAFTSHVKRPLIVDQRGDTLQLVAAPNSPDALVIGESVPGRGMFRIATSGKRKIRSVKSLDSSPLFAILDEDGYLHLKNNHRFWKSERSWGDRLAIIGENIVAIIDSRQRSFVAYKVTADSVVLLGQAPALNGRISALASAQFDGENGVVVSTVIEDGDGVPWSQLQFLPRKHLRWQTATYYAMPKFPDYDASFHIVLNERQTNYSERLTGEIPCQLWTNLLATLYRMDEKRDIVPYLASSATADSNFRSWRIRLKDDLRFADGMPLLSFNVIKSWEHNVRKGFANEENWRWMWQNIGGIEEFIAGGDTSISGIAAVDEKTVQVSFSVPQPKFIEYLTRPCFSILNTENKSRKWMSAAPLQIKRMVRDSYIHCERNPYFHEGMPFLKEIYIFKHQKDILDRMQKYSNSGTFIQHRNDVDYFNQMPSVDLNRFYDMSTYFIALNPGVNALRNRKTRASIVTALDREVFANALNQAEAYSATGFFSNLDEGLQLPRPTGALRNPHRVTIAFLGEDAVSREIAERLHVRLTQLSIIASSIMALSYENFNQFKKSGKYHILVDSYVPQFGSRICDLSQLLHNHYKTDSHTISMIDSLLAIPQPAYPKHLEQALIHEVFLYPVLNVVSYATYPSELRNVRLNWGQHLDLSRAWFPIY